MNTLLIVEDEIASRDGLKNLFLGSSLSLQVITAADGVEGYEKALEYTPDIIISDIRMPRCDGLTMLERLREAGFSCRFLLLTGFAEFSYAQKAIQNGVTDYILKPVVPNLLLEQVKNLLEQIQREREYIIPASSTSKLYLLSEDDLPLFRSQLSCKEYTDYFIACVYMEQETHLPLEVKSTLQAMSDTYIVTLADHHYRGILIGFRSHRILHSVISKLSVLLQSFPHLACVYTIKKENQVQSWLSEYDNLLNSMIWSITYDSAFFSYDPQMSQEENPERQETEHPRESEQFRKKLQQLYFSGNYSGCHSAILSALKLLQEKQIPPKQIRLMAVSSISKTVSEQQYLQAINTLSNAKTMHEISSCLTEYFHNVPDQHQGVQYSKLVQSSIRIIQSQYSQAISLSGVSEKLSITPQYLSKLFVQETGQSFVDYLISVRMEKAKSLLTETSLMINVIGTQIGYPDPKYFCTSFKKYTGLSPNQYRKNQNP